jgi:hypothetical protein
MFSALDMYMMDDMYQLFLLDTAPDSLTHSIPVLLDRHSLTHSKTKI